jgi:parallel beta-helix repeat protein
VTIILLLGLFIPKIPINTHASITGTPPPALGDWIIANYTVCDGEVILLYGDLIIQNGGHLVLRNTELMMMSQYLQPFDIIVEEGGIMEVYDSYITDIPDDDDTELLSAYYYFTARTGSTLIIENSTVRQNGFIDLANPEHLGLSISTNSGHIRNSRINSTLVGLAFFGNNTGFSVENSNISQIGMSAIMLNNADGVKLNNISFWETGESNVVDAQSSKNFKIEDLNLQNEQFLRMEYSMGFEIKNITSINPENVLEIRDCDNFMVSNVDIIDPLNWNRRIEIERCSNFTVDNVNNTDDFNAIYVGDSSHGTISNIKGFNLSFMIDGERSDNITVSDVTAEEGETIIRFFDSEHITLDKINITNATRPISLYTVNHSTVSNLSIYEIKDFGIEIRSLSNNISLSKIIMESNALSFTTGLSIDLSYNISVVDFYSYDLDLSIISNRGDLFGEDIYMDGSVVRKNGIRLLSANKVYLSNVSIQNKVTWGLEFWYCMPTGIRVDNLFIQDTDAAVESRGTNITISNITVGASLKDIIAIDGSYITIMNSSLDKIEIFDSGVTLINTTNSTNTLINGASSLTRKWWVDVFVEDKAGAVSGANVVVLDKLFNADGTSKTDSNGFARNIAVTEVIWTFGPTMDTLNPHLTQASGDGWSFTNSTFYQVKSNMQVNITIPDDTPPFGPKNLIARSNELSNTILTWDASESGDVKGYNIYIAKSMSILNNYMTIGIPNATVSENSFTHLSGSEDWQEYWYGVKTIDNENESIESQRTSCGDWVVNITSPQFVENMAIFLSGSLMIYGQLELYNTTLNLDVGSLGKSRIYVNNSGILLSDNIIISRKGVSPYSFVIQPDAVININNSEIVQPGVDQFSDEVTEIGIFSLTNNLTITNTKIEIKLGGLGLYEVSDFNGLIYNVSFTTTPSINPAEYYIKIMNSYNVTISNCTLNGWTLNGIYAESSTGIGISQSQINAERFDIRPTLGIYFNDCTNAYISDNTLIKGFPAVYITSSTNTTIRNSNISGNSLYGIYIEHSWYTTIQECYYDTQNDRPDIGIYLTFCRESTVRDMITGEINEFLVMENESFAIIDNLTISNGDIGVQLINSDNILMNNSYINFIQNGMKITGGREISLINSEINLTLYGLEIKSPGPIYLINFTLANCISGELIAEGFSAEPGNIIFTNSTISPLSEKSFILNNSAVVHMINTTLNQSKIKIEDGASRVEIYHYLSVQVYDIDNNFPTWANITIINEKDDMIYDDTAINGLSQWILVHEKTIFRDNTYLDNPHKIYVFDGSHLGMTEVYINYSQHIDVQVSNQFPIITLIGIIGFYDEPFPIPDDITLFPKTNYDIVLSYTYEDPENDPESGTIIHWYINGVYNSSLDNMSTITPQYTQKGQLWQAYVYPSDGYDSTFPIYAFESNIIPIINTPPSVSNVTITPTDPTGGDDLFVTFKVFDLDDDGLDSAKTTSRWYRWNEGINDWEYSSIDNFYLPSLYTSKGEIWKCEVTPHDGDSAGTLVKSQNVSIGNTPPSIQNVRITSQSGSTQIAGANNLKVQYVFFDADSDSENGSAYEWQYQRSGSSWTSVSVNSSILPNSYTQRGDLWRCKVIPKDKDDFGLEVLTDAVEIFNTPPQVTNVIINPQLPTSSDSLEITYDFYDYDGDSDNGTAFRWVYEDALGSKESGIHGNVTPLGVLVKDQIWYCFIIPSDGINSGLEIRSDGVLILNSAPSVEEAEIEIVTTELDMHLYLNYNAEDIDGDNLDTFNISWYKNNNPESLFDDNETVSENHLIKDDSWYARVKIFDGLDWSEWFQTDSIIVPNTAPEISGVPTLSDSRVNSTEDLIPAFSSLYEDEDGDILSSWEIWWYRDNGHMDEYDDMQEIPWDLTSKGEIWYYKVRVSDGEDFSEWVSSTTTLIENSEPSNVILNIMDPDVTLTETENKEFQVSAEDKDDGDTLSFRWTLDGRIVLFEEGVSNSIYLHKTDYDSEGEYILRLVVSDGDDTYETTWNVNVQKKNRLPEIRVVEPEGKTASIKEMENLNFAITKSDADGDSLEVIWYVDGVEVFEGSDKYTFSPDYSSSRSRTITAEVSETETGANSTFSWDIAVADVLEGADREEFLGLSFDAWGLIMAVISGLAAILLFLFGFYRVRKKKGRLKEHMVEMDQILSEDEDPEVIEDKLAEFETQIREEFAQGKLEDLHFLMLEEIIASRKGEVRKAEVSQKFGRLPKNVLQDLDKMLEDGNITKEEYEDFVGTISKSESLSPAQKEELSKMIGEWEAEDKDGEDGEKSKEKEKPKKDVDEEESQSEKVEPIKDEIDNEIEEIMDSLDEKNDQH